MHRLLVSAALLAEEAPTLPKDAAKHLRVLRPTEGEEVELFDGCGGTRRYAVTGAGTREPSLRPMGARAYQPSDPARALTLFACITKGSRWDWTIEKATELGVTRIVPVISERTIVRLSPRERPAKQERYRRIAEDAARQSDAVWIPEVALPLDFPAALALARETTCFVGALTTPPPPLLAEAILARRHDSHARPPALFVGPEGDFTPAELAELLTFGIPTSFGPQVLRAETAAIYGLSVLSALFLV